MHTSPHRFDKLARRAVAPIWEYASAAISTLRKRLIDRTDDLGDIKRALAKAEAYVRSALILMCEKIFVVPAKHRERSDLTGARASPPAFAFRAPLFQLAVDAKQDPPSNPGAPESDEIPNAAREVSEPPSAGLYNSALDRRIIALEDVLRHPGKHAARMKRALHAQTAEADAPIRLQSENQVLLAHIIRAAEDPAYCRTDEFTRLHARMLESG